MKFYEDIFYGIFKADRCQEAFDEFNKGKVSGRILLDFEGLEDKEDNSKDNYQEIEENAYYISRSTNKESKIFEVCKVLTINNDNLAYERILYNPTNKKEETLYNGNIPIAQFKMFFPIKINLN